MGRLLRADACSPRRIDLRVVLLGLIVCAGGCRGNAYRDAYNEKMAGEIRVLEDQLYAADYENKVLRDKLHRSHDAEEIAPRRAAESDADDVETDVELPSGLKGSERPDTRLLPPPSGLPRNDDDSMNDRRIDIPGERPRSGDPDAGLEPPDIDDLEMPEIEIGTPAPPSSSTGEPELPPNQVPKTEAQQKLEQSLLPPPVPAGLAIHPGFSGGHRFDDEASSQGVYLVIHFVDEQGKPLDMSTSEIDAELSIVLLDPTPNVEDPRLGRWDFSPEEIVDMRRDAPTDSIHVALPFENAQPAGDKVAAFVRLANGDQLLEGKADVFLENPPTVAGWQKSVRP